MRIQIPVDRLRRWFFGAGLAAVATQGTVLADYPTLIKSDNPKAYYRLNDSTARTLINKNSGSLGAAGDATNDLATVTGGVVRPMPGAIVGDSDRAEFFDFTCRTEIPFNPAINTPNTQPFTVEAWLYPVSDAVGNGMGVLGNRWTQGGNRQGWVVFQRAVDSTHCTSCGPGVGWNFRMYNDVSTSTALDVTSGVPFTLGKWQHMVVVYDPVQVTNATLTIYIDGVQANQAVWSGSNPGYGPNTGDHSPAPNGQPNMSLGGYNNANSGTFGFANPWTGGIDEFAWYPTKLTDAQILAHYQNGTNANRSQSYSSLVKSLNPTVYLRLDEIAPGADVAVNYGDLRSAAVGTNTAEVTHPATGPLVGRASGAVSYHQRNGKSTTDMPWLAKNNPDAGVPFTFETWIRPTSDRQNPGAALVNNRYVSSGHRTGWVIFQRAPNASYTGVSGYSGVGWNFRMFDGVTGSGQDVTTSVPYNMNEWQHLVVTWEPQGDNGDPGGNGNHQASGILTAYFNGEAVASNTAALYAANTNPTENAAPAADLAIGAYNIASTLGDNPFEGDLAHLAFYNNYVLTPDQIQAHYQAGTNANFGTNYETLVYTAASEALGFIAEGTTIPVTYLPFNDPARAPLINAGSVGAAADGYLVLATNDAAGPQSPLYPGFDALNAALALDGTKPFASFNNPAGLNLSGQISLEAWVLPAASQGSVARVLSHGPQTITSYLSQNRESAVTNTSEVFLRIDGNGANYSVGSAQYIDDGSGLTTYAASAAVPGTDLGGGTWIHLVGTYDGANWKLYRNGVLLATQPSGVGALAVDAGNWAIGSTGNGWADAFAGAIDEVAVYGYALSANQVLGHYHAGVSTPRVAITRSGNNVSITWPYGTLYQADSVTGPWTAVPGNPTSPLTIPAGGASKFYRF